MSLPQLKYSSPLIVQPVVFNGLVRSDHLAITVTPRVAAKPDMSFVYFRDVRAHRKIQMEHKLEAYVWSNALSCDDITEAIQLLENTLKKIFNDCFPLIKGMYGNIFQIEA